MARSLVRGAVTTLPVVDLARARRFYEGVLGLRPVWLSADEAVLDAGSGTRLLLAARGEVPTGKNTAFSVEVAELEAAMAFLRDQGVRFKDYDLAGLRTHAGVFEQSHVRNAWFLDPEGNLVSVHEPKEQSIRVVT